MLRRSLVRLRNSSRKHPVPLPPPDDALPRGCMTGIVVSDAMQKTVNVRVERLRTVPKYNLKQKYHRKYMAHDEFEKCSLGDTVRISPCRPLSKRKHFLVQSIIKKAKEIDLY